MEECVRLGGLCNHKLPLKFKEKVYKLMVWLTMLYEVKCGTMKRVHE